MTARRVFVQGVLLGIAVGLLGCGSSKDDCPRARETLVSEETGACTAADEALAASTAPPTPPSGSAAGASPSSSASVAVGSARPVPPNYVKMFPSTLIPTDAGAALLLAREDEPSEDTVLPIFIGGTEAISIDLRMRQEHYARPLTHDLLDASVAKLGGKVIEARITKLENQIFHGRIFVQRGAEILEIDARPSDAIALALGNKAPLYVAVEVLDRAAVSKSEILKSPNGRKTGNPTML